MKKTSLPYLEFKTVKGRPYVYFRKGTTRIRLPDNPDSEAFAEAYWACRSGKRRAPVTTSWDALITQYLGSETFLALAPGTRENYRRHCDDIRAKNGPKDMRTFRRKHAIAARDALAATWSKANDRVSVLSNLCKLAVDNEWIDRNPVTDIVKLKGGEYRPWPAAKLKAFETCCTTTGNETARTGYELMLGTGQRIGDCANMEWADFDGEYMAVVQEKTGTKIWVYCPKRLQAYLSSLPKRGRYILARNLTQPLGKRAVQKAIEEVRQLIDAMVGDDRLVPHGWRYNAAVELSEAGCSDAEIQSVTGHKSLQMVQKYRRQADQKKASRRAQTRREQSMEKS